MSSSVLFSEETPMPGTQVAQSVVLPASTSVWNTPPGGNRLIIEPTPVDASKTDTVRYWLFLPADYESQAESGGAPLLLFLHGAGERGDAPEDLDKVKTIGVARMLERPEFAKKFPCVTVSPQCKNGYVHSPGQLMLLLDHIEKNYKIDKSRVYITGLSMGGLGTWTCLYESADRFAAAAPICGGAKTEWAEKMTGLPIWVFHGDADPIVALSLSQNMVDALRKAGGKSVLFTVYEGVDHDSWTRTYNNPLFFDWMFQQKRNNAK